ncbi:MAG TPA: AcvB/VirJ family lysyl-phosphatidylglycerol hydrolase [Thermoanaerobaculia bacterium]|nr:AcvB/VirJ family lysyl-phosphatidylglycerol hydrolase [Thermoanaerobaculia bacterium]
MKYAILPLLILLAGAASAATTTLPLVEVPATRGTSDTLVVFVSGDGGWAAIDRDISRVLAANGMPVVGLNALQYFWKKRTPETSSHDLATIIDRYLETWHKSRVLLVGYSRGADVLPAMVSRLPAETQAKVRMITLLGPSRTVEFEFHVADWMRNTSAGMPVKPEVDKLVSQRILCLYGEDDHDALCRELIGRPQTDVVTLKGAHHFDGGYDKLGQIIIEHLK